MYRSILVALDGSAQSAKVLELAGSLSTAGTTLHLVCVVDAAYALPDPDDGFDQEQYPAAAHEQHHAQALLEQARCELLSRDLTCTCNTLTGQPAQAICTEAARLGSDLIVIGHRHLSRLERLFSPSVGNQILNTAPCPVLVEVR
ncbi:universal stress protein [Pseudomonas ovata]|uniref:universal stress protein n=1 Tax=Pseudomonas ovata TaxID=1839709 RepID=UPI000D69A60E|nr:universal stress protein [Pseudomonas ovata]